MLLCVLSHPTQYDPPLWSAMTAAGRLEPTVWYASESPPDDAEIKQRVGWHAGNVEFEHRSLSLKALPEALWAVRHSVQAVLVPGWVSPITRVVLPIARALGIPVITSTDKTLNDPGYKPPLDHAAAAFHAVRSRLFQGFFTTGISGEQYLVSLGCPRASIARGLYPIDAKRFQAAIGQDVLQATEIRTRFGGRRFVLLAVCKLVERESPLDILRAFARVRALRDDVALVHVGDGPLRDDYKAQVEKLGLQADVALPGYVPYAELPAYYALCSAFIHVARYEPWGISVLEAMACGRPVIAATTVGSATDLVVHGRTGALCYQSDLDSIAGAINLVAERSTTSDMGAAAAEAVGQFDVGQVGEGLCDLVERLRHEPTPESVLNVARSHIRNNFGRHHL